ncbi:MAG TPA: dihydrodipicolinate synthase family protein [Pseudonocardia sp.]|jgi:4-hydroxy-tetrahydrodipicolinate synthase
MSFPPAAVLTAAATPFDRDGGLDEDGARTLFRFLRDAGVDGVFCAGTTGEFTALDRDERRAVVAVALEVFGADRVIAHVGAPAARQARALAEDALAAGATAVAAISPFYLRPRPAAVHAYYAELDRALDGRAALYPYLFRECTGYPTGPEELAALAELPSVAGAKVSGESAERIGEYVRAVPAGFPVFTGNDAEFAASVRLGAAGTTSGTSSAFPEVFVALGAALRNGDPGEVAAADRAVRDAVAACSGIPLVKAGLAGRGLPAGPYRVAQDPPAPGQLTALNAELGRR